MEDILVSWSYCNKLPQIWWLKTTIYSFTVLEARIPSGDFGRATVPLKALGENSSLPLPASGGSWSFLVDNNRTPVCHHIHMAFSPV